ncbi:hypothetical protein ACF0H5_020309 [Mactra antiquata]
MQANTLEIFRPPGYRRAAHIASDVPRWVTMYHQLCKGHEEHRKSLKEMYKKTDEYCKPFEPSKISNSTAPQKSLDKLQNVIKEIQEARQEQIRKHQEAERAFRDIYNSLRHNVEQQALTMKFEKEYTIARDTLDRQTATVDICKKKYHQLMFRIEKTRIKSTLATRPKTVYKAEGKVKHLLKKRAKYTEQYETALVNWRKEAEMLSKIAAELEVVFIKEESARANLVIGNLAACCNNDKTGLKPKDESEMLFRGIDGKAIITNVTTQLKEIITIPVFEPYIAGDSEDTYAAAKAELDVEELEQGDEHEDDLEKLSDTEFKNDMQANRKLKKLRKSNVFIVTEEYKKQKPSELNLHLGDKIKQLLPVNGDGMSYGEVIHGKLHKKKKGFYQDMNVKPFDVLQSDDEDDDRMSKKQKKKKVKKVIARVKSEHKEVEMPDSDNETRNILNIYSTDNADSNWSDNDDESDNDDNNGTKHKKKSKLKRLMQVVKPKKNEITENVQDDIIIDMNKEIDKDHEEDVLTIYKKKTRREKIANAMVVFKGTKSESVEENKDDECVDTKKKTHKWKNPLKTIRPEKKNKKPEAVTSTIISNLEHNVEINDKQEDVPKKKLKKKFFKVPKIFKRGKIGKKPENEEDNTSTNALDFQFIKRNAPVLNGNVDVTYDDVFYFDNDDDDGEDMM